jgi:thymidine kinase
MCHQHGSKKKQCSKNGCTNNAIRKGVCINHGAKRYYTMINCGKALFQTGMLLVGAIDNWYAPCWSSRHYHGHHQFNHIQGV